MIMYQTIITKQDSISLEENTHTYTLCNSSIQFTSVTEFINQFFQPFDENKIAEKLTKMRKYEHLSIQDILNDWEGRRNRGTIIHQEIEKYLNKNLEEHSQLDEKSQQAIEFLKKKCINKNNLLFSEVKIYSEKLKLAGTIDLMIYNKQKNRIYIIDWKTNEKIKKHGYNKGILPPANLIDDCSFNRYELQLSIYQYILENAYNSKVDGLYIVHLKKNSHKILKCDFRKNHVSNMLKIIE